jgi:integrase
VARHRETTGIRWPDATGEKREHRIGADRVSRNQRAAYDQGMEILQQRVLLHKHPELAPSAAIAADTSNRTPSLAEAFDAFKAIYFDGDEPATPDMQRRYKGAYRYFLMTEEDGDIPLSYEALVERIIANRQRCSLAPETRQKYLQGVGFILRYWIERGWLTRNPLTATGATPTLDDEEDNRIFEPAEVRKIEKQFHTVGQPLMALLVRWIALTGMRIGEVCKLHWSDFHQVKGHLSHFVIHGKRVKRISHQSRDREKGWARDPKLRGGRLRNFPLTDAKGHESIPGIAALVDQLKEYEHLHGGWVFPWRSRSEMYRSMIECLEALHIRDGRSFHTLRKTAIWYWEHRLNLPKDLRGDLAGHDADTARTHYRRNQLPATDLQEQLTRHRSPKAKPL